MTVKRFTIQNERTIKDNQNATKNAYVLSYKSDAEEVCNLLNEFNEENEQLIQFIQELTTKGTGRIDLANGYSFNIKAILTDFIGDLE